MTAAPKPPKVPCGSCPYRKDVPPGIWEAVEYGKLPAYDGETWEQAAQGAFALFMCHQNDGRLCGGWLLTHPREHLLALRLHKVDPSVWTYGPDVEVFGSGAAAAAHGLSGIDEPPPEAARKIAGLLRKRAARP
jgi:hypothetical protein